MSDSFLSALVAAGGNSRAARSARARLQFRDRYGRWVDMGRGLKFKFRDGNGVTRSVVGTFVGAKASDTAQVYVSKDPSGLPDGFYDVKSSNAQEFIAHLNEEQLQARGIQVGVDSEGRPVGERAKEDVPNISELVRGDAPEGWFAIPGTFGGKKVIQTDDNDFRVHFAGKDDRVLLEDRRATPGQAVEQRSVAEAFKRVNDVDVQREDSGDAAYSDLAEDNEAKVAQISRDDKVDQIKLFQAQIANDRVSADQKHRASENIAKLKSDLEADGQPYDPDGEDSDEARAARKAAGEAGKPGADGLPSAQGIDTSTFDVAPEGFLVPTGKKTDDISAEGLAKIITDEQESLSKGGARLVVDKEAGTAEVYNSADTIENAKAQAGGLGQNEVLDLAEGKSVKVSDNAVDPNSPGVNPNLGGETGEEPAAKDAHAEGRRWANERAWTMPTDGGDFNPADRSSREAGEAELRDKASKEYQARNPEASEKDIKDFEDGFAGREKSQETPQIKEPENGEDRNTDAVEPERTDAGTDSTTGGEPDGEVERREPAGTDAGERSADGADSAGEVDPVEKRRAELEEQIAREQSKVNSAWASDDHGRRQNAEDRLYELRSQLRRLPAKDKGAPGEPADRGVTTPDEGGEPETPSSITPGSKEDLEARRAQVQTALENSGDPKDIIALNEQADALDNRIKASEPVRRTAGDVSRDMEANEAERQEILRLSNESGGNADTLRGGDLESLESRANKAEAKADDLNRTLNRLETRVIPKLEKDYAALRRELDEVNGVQTLDFDADRTSPKVDSKPVAEEPDALEVEPQPSEADMLDERIMELESRLRVVNGDTAGVARRREFIEDLKAQRDSLPVDPETPKENWADNPLKPTKDEVKNAPAGSLIAEEHNESGDKRLFRKREDGKWEQIKTDGSGEPTGYVTRGDTFDHQGSASHYATDMDGTRPRDPAVQRRMDEQSARMEAVGVQQEADPRPAANSGSEYQEPGDADETTRLRNVIDEIDAEIEAQLNSAESSSDPQVQAEHMSRVRSLERQRKIQENALNRALGNEPMDFNKDLGWSMTDRDNRGSLPQPPEGADAPTAPARLPEETPDEPDMGTPAIFDEDLDKSLEDRKNLDALRRRLLGEPMSEEDKRRVEAVDAAEASKSLEDKLAEAQADLDRREEEYKNVLLKDDYTDEEFERAEDLRDTAKSWVEYAQDNIEMRDSYAGAEEDEARDATMQDGSPEISDIISESESNVDLIDSIDPEEGAGGLFDQKDDPDNVSSGHGNGVSAAKAELQGKDMPENDREQFETALDSDSLSDSQLDTLRKAIALHPNRANTVTTPRPEREQPGYNSRADAAIIDAERNDPDFVFDEDLTWRTILEEYPDAVEMDNGDLLLGTEVKTTKAGISKRYELMLRRTNQNRFIPYIIETDQNSNRRAKRLGNTEWHSYEALEKRLERGRTILAGPRPSSFFANNKDTPTENLGAKPFPDDDFLGDFANPDAELPETGDEKYDRLIQKAAEHIRNGNGDLDFIESELEKMDPGASAVKTIMNAILGRVQSLYRPDTSKPFQLYDGETAEVGMDVDWTNWHQEKDWWLVDKDGRRYENPNKTPNPNYGLVSRGKVMGYVKENTDGKGHTYGDHVWVQFYDNNGRPVGTQVKRSAQTLRLADPGAPTGAPFFSKKEEWRSNPEELVRRFRLPTSDGNGSATTHERPKGDLPKTRTVSFTPRGTLPGYTSVTVPESPAEIAGLIARGEITPSVMPVSDIRPGMMVVRMDDDGNQNVDTVIRVENLGDGGYRIHAARPDGKGRAVVDSFVIPGDMEVPVFSGAAPKPNNRPRKSVGPGRGITGKTVEYSQGGKTGNGVVLREESDGSLLVETPDSGLLMLPPEDVTQISKAGAASAIRADLMELLEDADVPPALRQSILYKLFSSRTSSAMIGQLTSLINSFDSKTPKSRALDSIFNILKVSPTVQNRIRAALKEDQ